MSFAKAKRFSYSPFLLSSSENDKKKTAGSSEKKMKKDDGKTYRMVKCTGRNSNVSRLYYKAEKVEQRQSTFVKETETTESDETSHSNSTDEHINLEESFSSCCSSEPMFQDEYPDSNIDEIIVENVYVSKKNEEMEQVNKSHEAHREIAKKDTNINNNKNMLETNINHDNNTFTNIKEVHDKTMMNLKNEMVKMFSEFLENLTKTYENVLEKMNTQCQGTTESKARNIKSTRRTFDRKLRMENVNKRDVKTLTEVIKKKQGSIEDMEVYHMELLGKAEQKVYEYECLVDTLKAELECLLIQSKFDKLRRNMDFD